MAGIFLGGFFWAGGGRLGGGDGVGAGLLFLGWVVGRGVGAGFDH